MVGRRHDSRRSRARQTAGVVGLTTVTILTCVDMAKTRYLVRALMSLLALCQRLPFVSLALLFSLIMAISQVGPVPISVTCPAGSYIFCQRYGVVFGIFLCSAVSTAGAAVGCSVAFLLSRRACRGWASSALESSNILRALDTVLGTRRGLRIVALLRLSPLLQQAVSYALGLTAVSFTDYLLGSTVGMVPYVLLMAYLGSALTSLDGMGGGDSATGAGAPEGDGGGGGAGSSGPELSPWTKGLEVGGGVLAAGVATLLIARYSKQAIDDAVRKEQEAAAARGNHLETERLTGTVTVAGTHGDTAVNVEMPPTRGATDDVHSGVGALPPAAGGSRRGHGAHQVGGASVAHAASGLGGGGVTGHVTRDVADMSVVDPRLLGAAPPILAPPPGGKSRLGASHVVASAGGAGQKRWGLPVAMRRVLHRRGSHGALSERDRSLSGSGHGRPSHDERRLWGTGVEGRVMISHTHSASSGSLSSLPVALSSAGLEGVQTGPASAGSHRDGGASAADQLVYEYSSAGRGSAWSAL